MDEIERLQKLQRWYELKQKIEEFKPTVEAEKVLREELAESFFPTKVVGSRTHPLTYGWALKATFKLDRKVDEAVLPSVVAELGAMSVNTDVLIARKPTLVAKEYTNLKKLNPEAIKIFDKALIIKWATPTLEMVPPPAPKHEVDGPRGQETL